MGIAVAASWACGEIHGRGRFVPLVRPVMKLACEEIAEELSSDAASRHVVAEHDNLMAMMTVMLPTWTGSLLVCSVSLHRGSA